MLGASGGIGGWVVPLAVERGHQVTALVAERRQLLIEPRILLGSREFIPLGRTASIISQALFADD